MIRQRIVIALGIMTTTIIILGVFCVLIFRIHIEGNVKGDTFDYSDGWYYTDGTAVDMDNLDFNKESKVIKKGNWDEISGTSFCFETTNLVFDVYLGDELIYDYHPKLGGLYGEYYGEYLHTVNVPAFEGEKELKIDFTALNTEVKWTQFRDIKIGDSWSYIRDIVRENALRFSLCFLILLFGCILAIFGLIFGKSTMNSIEIVSLGVMAMNLGVWTNSSTRIIALVTGNPAAVRVLEHYTLMLLPLPALSFTAYLTKSFKNVLIWMSAVFTCILLVLYITLIPLGVCDYHEMLKYTHLNLGFGLLVVIYLIINAIKRKIFDNSGIITMLTAFIILVLSGAIDFVLYYMDNSLDAARFTRFGLLAFVGILGFYEVREAIHVSTKSLDADEKNRMAHLDGLTGLLNRLAFSEKEEEIARKRNGQCVFIELDVNNLKKVNDNYGHTEGDKHIIGAANIITKSFGQFGSIYRVGGDEFVGIIEGYEAEAMANAAAEELVKFYNEYNERNNPPVKLEIAYGIAVYDYDTGDPEQAERIADDRMYECKRVLKHTSAIKDAMATVAANEVGTC